jgi:hypothetical protein
MLLLQSHFCSTDNSLQALRAKLYGGSQRGSNEGAMWTSVAGRRVVL